MKSKYLLSLVAILCSTATFARDLSVSNPEAGEKSVTVSNIQFSIFLSQVNLQWTDVNNIDGSTTYTVYRDAERIATTQIMSHQDMKLSTEITYNYQIKILQTNGTEADLVGASGSATTTKRRIRIQVYETAGESFASQPVSVFIPLPYGIYTQTTAQLASTFVLKDSTNQLIPAQYSVRSRGQVQILL